MAHGTCHSFKFDLWSTPETCQKPWKNPKINYKYKIMKIFTQTPCNNLILKHKKQYSHIWSSKEFLEHCIGTVARFDIPSRCILRNFEKRKKNKLKNAFNSHGRNTRTKACKFLFVFKQSSEQVHKEIFWSTTWHFWTLK